MKALITGIAGFAGSHLAEHLISKGHQISGIALPGTYPVNLEHIRDQVELHEGDLLNRNGIKTIIERVEPDRVYHLAALSSVSASWDDPARTFELNLNTGINLLESCAGLKNDLRILLVSSSDIYGGGDGSSTLTEDSPFAPNNPYAESKLALDLASEKIAELTNLHIVRMRPMNHTGPRQALGFVIQDMAKQIADIEAGNQEPVVQTGNLDARRDFTDVRDVVRAYALAIEAGPPGEVYLVCSGRTIEIRNALNKLISLSNASIAISFDSRRQRPSESNVLSASHAKLTEATGWQPEISFEKTLRDILDYWRIKIGG